MSTATLLIVLCFLMFLLIVYLLYWLRKKQRGMFKIVIENGVIISRTETVPAEFLYDVQQIIRIKKTQHLVINGIGIKTSSPKLIFQGEISWQLSEKFQQSLTLSLQ